MEYELMRNYWGLGCTLGCVQRENPYNSLFSGGYRILHATFSIPVSKELS